jgi:hypothetical protein
VHVWHYQEAFQSVGLWIQIPVNGNMQEDFYTCCCLHSEMLDMMELIMNQYRVLHGLANQTEGMWLANGCDGGDDLQYKMEADEGIIGMHKKLLQFSRHSNNVNWQSTCISVGGSL